jgi:hypothetical protein
MAMESLTDIATLRFKKPLPSELRPSKGENVPSPIAIDIVTLRDGRFLKANKFLSDEGHKCKTKLVMLAHVCNFLLGEIVFLFKIDFSFI